MTTTPGQLAEVVLGKNQLQCQVAATIASHLVVPLVVNQPGRDANSDDLLQTARNWEESGDWGRGIDTYLSVSEYHVKNLAALEEIWEKAIGKEK